MVIRILVLALAFCAALSCARGDCDACVDGWCHSRKTLIQGFNVSDHLAIDQTNNILYVQINSNLNTAFFLEEVEIHLVQTLNTTGMAVDQETKTLYTAYDNTHVYKYRRQGSNTTDKISSESTIDIDLMFYDKYLYYTPKTQKGLRRIENGVDHYFTYLTDYKISDFVVAENDYVYFVANNNVYEYAMSWLHGPTIIANKTYVLSSDKYGQVYLGDTSINVIYKLSESKELVEFAGYKTGSVDRFLFDKGNNIVFHDALDGNIISWKSNFKKCSIHAPHAKYSIKEVTDEPCNGPVPEIEEQK